MIRPPKIIAFSGAAGHGKTTAANYLVNRYGFIRLSFAQPLRDMLSALGVTDEYLRDRKQDPCPALCGRTARHALQTLGTEWGRKHIAEDIWVRTTMTRVRSLVASCYFVTIDDVLFENEADAILEAGGLVIRLIRPGVDPLTVGHESEAGVTRVSGIIAASDITTLHQSIDTLLQ